MLLPAAILLAASIGTGFLPRLEPGLSRAASVVLTQPAAYAAAVLDGALWPAPPPAPPAPAAGLLERLVPGPAALGVAALALFRDRLPLPAGAGRPLQVLLRPPQAAHGGHIGDYVVWLVFGLAVLGLAIAAAARP
jgi:hypothetical protein